MDIKRTVLWVVFSFSLLLLWDGWNRHNGNPSMFFRRRLRSSPRLRQQAVRHATTAVRRLPVLHLRPLKLQARQSPKARRSPSPPMWSRLISIPSAVSSSVWNCSSIATLSTRPRIWCCSIPAPGHTYLAESRSDRWSVPEPQVDFHCQAGAVRWTTAMTCNWCWSRRKTASS